MKRLILIAFLFIGLISQAQISTLVGIVSKKKTTTSNQWVNIKFDPTTVRETISGWNWYLDNASPKTGLLDETGVNSGYLIEKVSGNDWQYEQETPDATIDPDFPQLVKKHMTYMNPSNTKTLRIGGLDNSKTYTLAFATFFSIGGSENRSSIVINSITYDFNPLASNSSMGKLYLTNISPTGGYITFQIVGSATGNYPCINGMKIKQN